MIAWLKKLFSKRKYADLKKGGVAMGSKKAKDLMKPRRK